MLQFENIKDFIAWRQQQKEPIAFVPTLGALHDGHLALVKAAHQYATNVVVSIFLNPLQFAPHEDFHKYPRTLAADLALLSPLSVAAVFTPTAAMLYPEEPSMTIAPGPLERHLCGLSRPHFFTGVTTVVMKLLQVVQPSHILLGEKDYQQLLMIKKMCRDFLMPTQVIGVPTVRENDGLAKSSRNGYLSADERQRAPMLYQTLQAMCERIHQGESMEVVIAWGRAQLESAGFKIDYLTILDQNNLESPSNATLNLRIFVAVWVGTTRLIDNLECVINSANLAMNH